jgi:hypothetical protein
MRVQVPLALPQYVTRKISCDSSDRKQRMKKIAKRAEELEFLRWFYQNADFGPASEDVYGSMRTRFVIETKKRLPEGYWDNESDGYGEPMPSDFAEKAFG